MTLDHLAEALGMVYDSLGKRPPRETRTSLCCSWPPLGELLTGGYGYCGRCHNWAEFKTNEEETKTNEEETNAV